MPARPGRRRPEDDKLCVLFPPLYLALSSCLVHFPLAIFSEGSVAIAGYLKCYSEAAGQMSHTDMSAPWLKAFQGEDISLGGCPVVHKIQ